MSQALEFTVREYEPGDETAILDAFNRIFAEVDPTFRPRSLEHWRWLYRDNPTGWRIYLCVLPDGKVISQYAGVPLPVRIDGEPAHFVQAVDSFADPEYVRGLRRPGPFVVTGYPFAANYGGPPPERTPVMYGLPVRPAWRIGRKFLGYELLRTQNKLSAAPERVDPAALGTSTGVELEEVARFTEEVAALGERLAGTAPVVTDRTRAHLDWRFADHPERTYAVALARSGSTGGALRGYAVFRRGDFDGEQGEGLICDWAVAPGDGAAGAALLAWLVERARAEGCPRLTTFLPDRAAAWLDLQRAGLRVAPTRYFLVGRPYEPRYTMRWLRASWSYTPADTDLF